MNLAVLKKTRRALQVGDIFAMQPPDGQFLFGRVISTDAGLLGLQGVVGTIMLIYIYSDRAVSRATVPDLVRERLLVPPMMTNRRPWTMGYFEHLENRPISVVDLLPVHCFSDASGRLVDELGRPVSGAVKPMGMFGVHSFRTIDDEISKALRIPLAPD
jgi:hypothetical protein